MLNFFVAFLALVQASTSLAQPAVQQTRTIVVDNRALCSDAGSRVAEGQRRQGRITAGRLARQLRAQGYRVRVVTLESGGDAGFLTDNVEPVLVRVDNGAC